MDVWANVDRLIDFSNGIAQIRVLFSQSPLFPALTGDLEFLVQQTKFRTSSEDFAVKVSAKKELILNSVENVFQVVVLCSRHSTLKLIESSPLMFWHLREPYPLLLIKLA